MTSRILQHIVGGDILFSGCVLLQGGLWLASRTTARQRWGPRFLFLGAVAVGLSATPFPAWFYLIWAVSVVSAIWLVPSPTDADPATKDISPAQHRLRRNWRVWSAVLVTMIAFIWELPYHFRPHITPLPQRIVLLGDSISAGIEEGETTWPGILADETDIAITDLSRVGATVATFNKLLDEKQIELPPGHVIIELGGNDLLGGTSSAQFAEQLDTLLSRIRPGHRVLMFELPLPPGYNAFGAVQRQLARRHSVRLIPKRDFASLLLSQTTTLDSLHLNAEGHRQFADYMAGILE